MPTKFLGLMVLTALFAVPAVLLATTDTHTWHVLGEIAIVAFFVYTLTLLVLDALDHQRRRQRERELPANAEWHELPQARRPRGAAPLL